MFSGVIMAAGGGLGLIVVAIVVAVTLSRRHRVDAGTETAADGSTQPNELRRCERFRSKSNEEVGRSSRIHKPFHGAASSSPAYGGSTLVRSVSLGVPKRHSPELSELR